MTIFARIKQLDLSKIDQKVILILWITQFRKMGKILFIICQDSSGYIQLVAKNNQFLINNLQKQQLGDLIKVWGFIRQKERTNKEVEIELTKFKLLNKTKQLPFVIREDSKISESTKYRYRYLDLRRINSKSLLLTKSLLLHEIRKFLHQRNFIEIDTPLLSPSSPEGAKCFLVPSNLAKRYYTLAQSPQIYKQLLMMSGFIRYYQIAKCFRNEGSRCDRQLEFLQLDAEISMANVKQIQKLVEDLLNKVLPKVVSHSINISFSSLTYDQVMQKYGNDKPDLRTNKKDQTKLIFLWITNWPLFKYYKEQKKYLSLRHPFTMLQKKFVKPFLHNKIEPETILGEAFDLTCNGLEILSGSLRIHNYQLQAKVLDILGYSEEQKDKHFGYFLEALQFAPPQHGGFGLGIERLLAVLFGIKNIKELIAFPKNIDGTCSLTHIPQYIKN